MRSKRRSGFLLVVSSALLLIYFAWHKKLNSSADRPPEQATHVYKQHHVPPNSDIVCHSPQCVAGYELRASRSTVPRIRHILWKSHQVSSYMARQLQTWQAIHPNWTYVLWRDSDMRSFIAQHHAGVLDKFLSLPDNMMRVDMIRYFILYHFGGVYADLDYMLVRPLDRFMKLPAVVTREAEVHSLFWFGLSSWPPNILGNPAFMMAKPGHPFFKFCTQHLNTRPPYHVLHFAGPLGLSDMLGLYAEAFSTGADSDSVVIVPASRCFYSFPGNSLASATSEYKPSILNRLRTLCGGLKNAQHPSVNITSYCRDLHNMDPITDPTETVYAIHDSNKSRSSYDDPAKLLEFYRNPVDIRSVLPDLVMANTIF